MQGAGVDFLFPDEPFFSLSVTVPNGWALGASVLVFEIADIPEGASTGVYGGIFGFDYEGNQIFMDLDLGDWGVGQGPCTDCGFYSDYFSPTFWFGASDLVPIKTVRIDQQLVMHDADLVDFQYFRVSGTFTATRVPEAVPEASALSLLGTAAMGLFVCCRRSLRR
jgi:hypothetical protein